MVGQTFINLLEEIHFPLNELRPFASSASKGKIIRSREHDWVVQELEPGCFKGLDLVFFSSGDDISLQWAPKAVEDGAHVVDNSAAFRMHEKFRLVVPEVNGHGLEKVSGPEVIANPNCSTIQLVQVLKPLLDAFDISAVKVATYQAVSGAGQDAFDELIDQVKDLSRMETPKVFPHPIAYNCIPQIGSFDDEGYSSEENKIVRETKKILERANLKVSAMTVRVPVLNSHSEAAWITLGKVVTKTELVNILKKAPGIIIQDEAKKSVYPTPAEVSGHDEVYVGRIHQDREDPYTWLMWIVADNLRKGAATNGINIAKKLLRI